MADIIDKLFSKIPKEKAPNALRVSLLELPAKKNNTGFAARLAFAFILAVFVTGGVYYKYFSVPKIQAAFELSAKDSDSAGISPNSEFILKSSKDITASQVKKVLEISPKVEFDVKALGNNRFEIKPKGELLGNAIYSVVIKEGAAEREYSWAFQVRSPFNSVSTFPRHQSTGVPINSSIEITFNREGITQIEKFFEISPKAEGRFEVHGENVVFLPKAPLLNQKIYSVKVKKGLTAKDSTESLTEDVSFAFETAPTSYNQWSNFGFSEEIMYFPPEKHPAVRLYEYSTNFDGSEANIFSFSDQNKFIEAYYKSRDWTLGWSYYYKQNGGLANTDSLNKVSSFKPQITKKDYETFIELPDKLAVGYYLLEVGSGGIKRQAWIVVNDISHYYSVSEQNSFVWAYEFGQKKPSPGAVVAYYDAWGKRREIGKTDNRGILEFNTPDALKANNNFYDESYSKPKFLEITPPGKPGTFALISAGWWYYGQGESANSFWKYLSTDRFTYRQADSLKFWGVLKGKDLDYKNQKVKVQLRSGWSYYDYMAPGFGSDSQDKPLAEIETTISSFDTIAGELKYLGAAPGNYQVVVLLNDKVVTQTSVEILSYVKPLYQVTVTPDKQMVFTGEAVTFAIKAEFYDGTPVSGLRLAYNGYAGGNNVNGVTVLNKKGEGQVVITPAYQKGFYYPSSAYLNFSPVKMEEGEITSETSAYVSVFGPKLYLQASQEYLGSNKFSIKAKSNQIVLNQLADTREQVRYSPEFIGSPARGTALRAEVEKVEYLQIEDGTYYDPINKTNSPKYRYEERKGIIYSTQGTTNESGEWKFDIELPDQERVSYIVRITGTDNEGHEISSQVWPYYSKDFGRYYYDQASLAGNRLVLSLGFQEGKFDYEKSFSVGENINLEAKAVQGSQYLKGDTLFYRYGNKGIGRIDLVKGTSFSEKFKSEFRPGVSYKAVTFGPYGFVESNGLLARYNQEGAKLNIQITPDKAAYKPGDSAKVMVEVKDKQGKAGSGEINLSVVDEAVFDVLPYYWQQDILESLFQIDYSEPQSKASDFTPPGFGEQGGAEGGGCFLAGTQISLPNGLTKSIENIKVGDVVLTRVSESDPRLVPAIVQGISKHKVYDYLVINGKLKVTPEHPLYVNGKWKAAGIVKVGDYFLGVDGKNVEVKSVEKVLAPETMVYNFNVGKFHTYFADGVYAHNAEKGGGYRSEFLDTAHFESKSLESGKAEFVLKLPDNLTSWRVTASVFDTSNIFAAKNAVNIKATLPFFVDSIISETYLTSDKPVIKARAFGTNYSDEAETSFELVVEGLGYKQTKVVKGGNTSFNLPALNPGDYEIKLKAKQSGMEDGVLRKFKVVESYFVSKESKEIKISEGMTTLPTGLNGYSDVTFTDSGKAKYYSELVWNQYQGGKRADQAAASYLSQKFLREHFGQNLDNAALDLGNYHVPDGALSLFTYGDSDLALSAKIADLVPESIYGPQVIQYFKNSTKDKNADLSRTSKALYGLASLKQPVLNKLQFIKDEPDLTFEDRLYVALGLARLGDKENARKIYFGKLKPEIHFEGGQAWLKGEDNQTKQVKLTALFGVAASAISENSDVSQVWKFLQSHYPSEDLDVLERLMIIKDQLAMANQAPASFTYELSGKKAEVVLEKGRSQTILFSKADLEKIRFSNVKGDVTALVVLERYKSPESMTKNPQLSIRREFLVNGKQATSFKEGETVLVRLVYALDKKSIDGAYQIVDFLPSGLRPISSLWQRGLSQDYSQCSYRAQPMSVEGNRVYFMAYHGTNFSSICTNFTIEYYARAAASGEFNVNPPLFQSLVNYDSLNIGERQTVKIIE
ncbi:MAG: Ig-like domain-containing protein [Candidatus Doudnabacteria bacterium]|nr:Ig-like domain-containing protein [Candidatus Doudnabacteria bacterium]